MENTKKCSKIEICLFKFFFVSVVRHLSTSCTDNTYIFIFDIFIRYQLPYSFEQKKAKLFFDILHKNYACIFNFQFFNVFSPIFINQNFNEAC